MLVAEVFDSFGATESISLAAWKETWRRSVGSEGGTMPTALMGIDGVLGLVGHGHEKGGVAGSR